MPLLSTPSRGGKCRLQFHAVTKRRQRTHQGRPRIGQPRKQLKGGFRHRTAQSSIELRTVETNPRTMRRGKRRATTREEEEKRKKEEDREREYIQGVLREEGDHHCDMEPTENDNEAEQPTKAQRSREFLSE